MGAFADARAAERAMANSGPNDPAEFARLPMKAQAALSAWIALVLRPAARAARVHSYGLKHDFERDGFYVTNGAFKGAMLAAGYEPVDATLLNWQFRIRSTCTCRRRHPPGLGGDSGEFGLWHADQVACAAFDELRLASV